MRRMITNLMLAIMPMGVFGLETPDWHADQAAKKVEYVCPPCGCDQDGKVFDKPGFCPAVGCGMELIPKPADPPAPAPN